MKVAEKVAKKAGDLLRELIMINDSDERNHATFAVINGLIASTVKRENLDEFFKVTREGVLEAYKHFEGVKVK